MTAIASARGDLTRWVACTIVVVGLHALGAAALLAWHDPIGVADESSAVVVDLAAYAPPSESTEDITPGPMQQEAAASAPRDKAEAKPDERPEPEEKVESKPEDKVEAKTESKPEEKVDVPPAPVPPVAAVPPPEAVEPPPPPPEPQAQPALPTIAMAPPRQHQATAAETSEWHKRIFARIQRHKAYPPSARARGEKGVVQVAFSIDRQGHLVSSRVARVSGHAALDQAAMATLEKAQPFPPPPADTPGEEFSFTVPVEFSIR
jgi:periplasmic protein TonB